jgi:hypothetical protein
MIGFVLSNDMNDVFFFKRFSIIVEDCTFIFCLVPLEMNMI